MWDYLGYTYNTFIIYISAFITTYWPWLLILTCLGVFAAMQPAKTKQLLAGLMLAAEKKAVEMAFETGEAKMDYVVDRAYNILPPIVRLFVSKDMLRIMAQRIFDEAKSKLQNAQIAPDPNLPEHDDITPIEPEEPPEK